MGKKQKQTKKENTSAKDILQKTEKSIELKQHDVILQMQQIMRL